MSRLLTAADRSALIRLASDLPKGSEERRAVLAGLKTAAESFDSFESGEAYRHEALSLIKKLGRPLGIRVQKVDRGIAKGLLGRDSIQDWKLVLMPTANPKRQGVKIGHGGGGYSAEDKLEVLGFYDVSRLSPEQLVKKHLLKVIAMGEW